MFLTLSFMVLAPACFIGPHAAKDCIVNFRDKAFVIIHSCVASVKKIHVTIEKKLLYLYKKMTAPTMGKIIRGAVATAILVAAFSISVHKLRCRNTCSIIYL